MNNLTVSYSPHIHGKENISKIMRDVIIALVPAMLGSIYFFGITALIVIATSVAFCVLFEYIWNKLIKKDNTTNDLSAIVTGILLALTLPPTIPLYMIIIGDAFAIIIVKCFYGGLGQNFVNPALAARAFLLACWPVAMTSFSKPQDPFGIFGKNVDSLSGATPLAVIKGESNEVANLLDLFLGNVSGSIGEVSALLILIGGIYLLIRKVINPVIPITYIVTVGLFGELFSDYGFLYHILSGGIMLAGFFMATDYVTSPVTKTGQFIYAFGAGLVTSVIRIFGGYPEGVTYAILIMNIITPLLDKNVKPRKFGKAVKDNE
ncbi:MAG: RnfABCDGE type electron transport complex subunit D [Clostridia bacterium]|nr:RnfABCDGE type electron transport complex subunit D [Clostridia bacterium]